MAQVASVAGYRIALQIPHDRQIKSRNRTGRLLCFVLTAGIILVIPAGLLWYWGQFLGNGTVGQVTGIIGFAVGTEFLARFAPRRMLLYVPEWTGYVTQNAFTGTMVAYGPGLHLTYWWESRNKIGNYSLMVITREFVTTIVSETAAVTVPGKYEYAIDLAYIERAVGISSSTVENGLTGFIKNYLNGEYSTFTAELIRSSVKQINEGLSRQFMDNPEILRKFGFVTISVVLGAISYSEKVQSARDAVESALQYLKITAAAYGMASEELKRRIGLKKDDPDSIGIEQYTKMLNRALASSGHGKLDIHAVEIDVPAVQGMLRGLFGGDK